ncbi:hypothetical protein N0V93_002633 [Gnomoniopsis smithogilvyi]|uniref:Uncharacterized protein n=1 Tax=Gnomoniopsis smithogilvyi TaxID=1191159 RepID=A0A9W8YXZ2_9PEZI|nr:hypothetical protein N0V93_002633 [Gnomoniopsis smithogilvyi]
MKKSPPLSLGIESFAHNMAYHCMEINSSAQVTFDPKDPFGFRAALEAKQTKIEQDQAEFLANLRRDMDRTAGARVGVSAAPTQPQKQAVAPGANGGAANAQAPLFGPAMVQQVTPSPDQIALKRQRLTTTYDPLNPPADDPTTAEGVRMGVVTDHDGRHWRQQSMRLGRWITQWKDTYPFASEPVDVDELTKAEKNWLDIKFRRRIATRRKPMKMAQGRGCTGRYWSLRRGNRTPSGRLNILSGAQSSGKRVPREDHKSNHASGAADDPDDVFGLPPRSFYRPLPASTARRRNPIFTAPLLKDVLDHFGIHSNQSPELETQLRALVPDDLFAQDHFLEEAHYPKVGDIPSPILGKMRSTIRAAGLVTTESAAPMATTQRPQSGKTVQQEAMRAKERQQFERDILNEAGLDYHDLPPSFRREMTKNILRVQNAGRELNAELRRAAALAAAAAAAAPVVPDIESASRPSAVPRPVFVDAARAAADQNRYWAENGDGNLITYPTSNPRHPRCSPDQLRRLVVLIDDDLSTTHVWVERRSVRTSVRYYVREDRTSGYTVVGRRSPEPTRMVTLGLAEGAELTIKESDVGTIPQHSHLAIVRCVPEVSDLEEPSSRLVDILHGGQRLSVPYNKLGSYLNATIAPSLSEKAPRMVTLSPKSAGPDIVIADVLVGSLSEHTNATIASCHPAVDASEQASQRLVRVYYNGALEHVPDNKLGSYIGGLINPSGEATKLPVPLGRTIDLMRSDGVVVNVPVPCVDQLRHGGATIVSDSSPAASNDERSSDRMVWITQQTDKGDLMVEIPDNHLGFYKGSAISQPKPALPNRIIQYKASLGGISLLPVAEFNNFRHQGSVIIDTLPDYDSLEMPSERLVHVKTRPELTDIAVPDNQLGRYPGSVICAPQSDDAAVDTNPSVESTVNSRIDLSRLVVLALPDGREIRVPVGSVSEQYYNGAKIIRTIPGRNSDEPDSTRLVHITHGSVHADVPDNMLERYQSWLIASPARLEVDVNSSNIPTGVRTLTTSAQSSFWLTAGQILEGDFAVNREARAEDDAQNATTPVNPLLQATIGQYKTPTQGHVTGQGNAPSQDNALVQGIPPTQADDFDDAETNVDYPVAMSAPEFISPSIKEFPNGRPDKHGDLPQLRPPRGDPDEVERLRLVRENMIRKEAVHDYIASAGTSRANIQSRTDSAPPTQPQMARTAKSSRVVKSGRGSNGTRSVRFGPLPTEEETGRSRGTGSRTRSGALYEMERKAEKGK